MKKLLTILGTTGLVVSTSTVLVSCGTNTNIESLVKSVPLTLDINDSKNKQSTITIDNLNKTKILLRFKGEHISENQDIKNEYISVSLTQEDTIASILIEAISVGTTTIEVIVFEDNEDLEFNNSQTVIETITITVIKEESNQEPTNPEDESNGSDETINNNDDNEQSNTEEEIEFEDDDNESIINPNDDQQNNSEEEFEEEF